jgi:flagellar basal body-associated protein FliL
VLLHFVLVAGGGFCLLYLPYNAAAASSSKLIILILMMLLYWIPMGIYLAVFRCFSAKAQRADAEPYRSVYGASRGK